MKTILTRRLLPALVLAAFVAGCATGSFKKDGYRTLGAAAVFLLGVSGLYPGRWPASWARLWMNRFEAM